MRRKPDRCFAYRRPDCSRPARATGRRCRRCRRAVPARTRRSRRSLSWRSPAGSPARRSRGRAEPASPVSASTVAPETSAARPGRNEIQPLRHLRDGYNYTIRSRLDRDSTAVRQPFDCLYLFIMNSYTRYTIKRK